MFIKECGGLLIARCLWWRNHLVNVWEVMAGGMPWCLPASPPLIKPLLQGVETWRGLHNALQCAGMGQSQWAAGSEKDRQRKSRGERHLRHLRLSPFHLQPDSYFLKLSTRWRLYDYSLPLRLSLFHSLFYTLLHTYTLSLSLGLSLFFLPLVKDSRNVHSTACGRLRLPIPSAK